MWSRRTAFPRRCGAGRLRRVVRARGRRVQMDGCLLGWTQLPASRSGGCVPSAVHSNVGTSDGGAGSIARAISAAAASTVAHVAALHVVMRVRRCARELLTGRKGPVRRLRLLRLLRLRRLRRLRRRRWRRLLVSFRDVVRLCAAGCKDVRRLRLPAVQERRRVAQVRRYRPTDAL